jgi:hypothetical protein
MKYSPKLTILTSVILLFTLGVSAQTFAPDNIAVLQASSSSVNNTTANILELNPNLLAQSTPVNSFTIPSSTLPDALRFSGSATSTGYLSNSSDGTLLCFNGHNSTTTSGNANTILQRGVGTLNSNYAFTVATTYTGTSGNQTRCATSLNNTTWFIADQGGIYSNSATTANPSGNFRSIKSFGGVVYVFKASSSSAPVATISAPVGGTITDLPGLPLGASTMQDFYMVNSGENGTTFDILYVLSASSTTAGSIQKYSLVSGSWVANGTSYNTTYGGFGLLATNGCNGVNLFLTSGTGALSANSVYKLFDQSGYNQPMNVTSANILYTAPSGTTLKGVAKAPKSCSAPTSSTLLIDGFSTICAGNTTTLKVDITGGTPPYNVVYSDGTTCYSILGYLSGSLIQVNPTSTTTYKLVSVTSSSTSCPGENNSGTVTITVNPTLSTSVSISPNVSNPMCGSSSVMFTATASGTGPLPTYTFYKNNIQVQTGAGNTYTDIPADGDTYKCYMTSSANCANPFTAISSDLVMNVNTIPTVVASPTSQTVCLGNSTTLNASGASTYTWMPGAGNSSSLTVSPSSNTTYTVTGTTSGCSSTATVAVTVAPNPSLSLNASPLLCNGASTTINSNVTSGTAPFYYVLNGSLPFQSSPQFNNVSAGSYTVLVSDANSCSATSAINLTQPLPINLSVIASAILCNGGISNITSSANGGTGAITYNLNSGPFQPTGLFANQTAGVYTITAQDANLCTITSTVSIVEPTQIIVSTSSTPIQCNGQLSSISVTASGGTGALQYKLNAGSYGLMSTFPNLSAGNYTITVRDANMCTVSDVITITQPNALSLTTNFAPISCNGGNTSLNVNGNGGTGALEYSLNNSTFGMSNSFSNLNAATYTITVRDANMCTYSTSVVIGQPSALVANSTSTPIICNGGSATVSVGASGGTLPYTGVGSFVVSSGPYSFTVTDANGCMSITSGTISQPSPLVANASVGTILCNGGTTSISVSAVGGVGPYTGIGLFSNVSAGPYNYLVTDANGCQAFAAGSLSQPSPVSVSASHAPIQCYGNFTNVIVSASGGTTPYTSGVGTFLQGAGNYTYTVIDNNGCMGELTNYNVTQPTQLVASSTVNPISCGQSIVTVNVSATGGTPPYGGTGPLTALIGFYGFTVTDANGCGAFTSGTTVAPNTVVVSATASTTNNCGGNSVIELNASGTGTNYNWQPGNLNGNTQLVVVPGNQTYTVTATSAGLCSATSVVSINLVTPSSQVAQSINNISFAGMTSQTNTHLDGLQLSYYNNNCDAIASIEDAAGGNVLGQTTVEVYIDLNVQQYNGQPYLRRHFNIVPTNNGPAIVKLYLPQADFMDYNSNAGMFPLLPTSGSNSDPNINNIRITKVSGGSLGIGSATVITPSVVWNGNFWELTFPVTSFSEFYIHGANPGNAALPVQLKWFDVIQNANNDQIAWATSIEKNNDYFTIETSTDGVRFSPLHQLNTLAQDGNSDIELSYSYTNYNYSLGKVFYRLSQTDIDGGSRIVSDVKHVYRGEGVLVSSIHPNPTRFQLSIDYYTTTPSKCIVHLIDMSGRKLKSIQWNSNSGSQEFTFDLSSFAEGVYQVQFVVNDKLISTQKVTKQN